MKTAIIAIAKHEAQYMDEWFKYHSDLGIDKFFIINNEDRNDHSQDDKIAELKKKYDIIQFDVRGPEELQRLGMQRGAYNYVYNFIRNGRLAFEDLEWVAFIDLDEFLYLDGKGVKEFLSKEVFADTTVIHLNWRIYGDNGQMLKSDKPVQERFTVQCPLDASYNGDEKPKGVLENMFVKQFLRVTYKKCMVDTHTTYFENDPMIFCRRADGSLSDWRWSADKLDGGNYYIKHYITKSLEEYIDRRLVDNTDVAHYVTPVEKRIAWYFNINEKTPEKVTYVKERLGIDV